MWHEHDDDDDERIGASAIDPGKPARAIDSLVQVRNPHRSSPQ
jgi:hypothetical protein